MRAASASAYWAGASLPDSEIATCKQLILCEAFENRQARGRKDVESGQNRGCTIRNFLTLEIGVQGEAFEGGCVSSQYFISGTVALRPIYI